jgi:hypothetical protein
MKTYKDKKIHMNKGHTLKLRHKKGSLPTETGSPNQCQCTINCSKPALPKKAFCIDHIKSCYNKTLLSDWEPEYDPSLWNLYIAIKETHNCYSYAMNVFDKKQIQRCKGQTECNSPFHQPGKASGHPKFSDYKPKTCPNMIARILGDNYTNYITDFETPCKPSYSKIALIIDESDDYHFLRMDSNGYWSHKPGGMRVTNVDAYGHYIWNPKLANYDYASRGKSELKYDIFCSYFCVKRNIPLYMKA